MKRKLVNLTQRYQAALREHLEQGALESARGLGSQALAAGLQTLDLARLHEQTLVTEVLPGFPARKRAALIKKAGIFFAAAITPIERVEMVNGRFTVESAPGKGTTIQAQIRLTNHARRGDNPNEENG